MKMMVRIVLGMILLFFLVFQPIRENILAAIPIHFDLDQKTKIQFYESASQIDQCDLRVIDKLGDSYALTNNVVMAAVTYGRGMICSPGTSLFRLKLGEMLLAMGYDGMPNIREAMALEPNNPYYQKEYDRIMAIVSKARQ